MKHSGKVFSKPGAGENVLQYSPRPRARTIECNLVPRAIQFFNSYWLILRAKLKTEKNQKLKIEWHLDRAENQLNP